MWGTDDDAETEFRSEKYPNSRTNNPNANWDNVVDHRTKAIWSDRSTIVSDEKTGMHPHIPYSYVSEDDVLWAKRVKRMIDVRLTQNHPLYFPLNVSYDNMINDQESGQLATQTLNEVLNGLDARKNFFQILKDGACTINPETGQPIISVYNSDLTRKYTFC